MTIGPAATLHSWRTNRQRQYAATIAAAPTRSLA